MSFLLAMLPNVLGSLPGTYDGRIAALSPIAYWKGNETDTWVDREGVENGIIFNDPLAATDTIVDLDSGGAAAAFNGSNQHVTITHNAALKPSTGALILTFQLDSLAEKAVLFAADFDAIAGGMSVEVEADGSPRCFIRDASGTAQIMTGPGGTVSIDVAYAFAVTWGANGFTGYVWDANENLIWTDSLPVTDGLSGTSEFLIGVFHQAPDTRTDGIISRVAMFDTQLSQSDLETVARPRTIDRAAIAAPQNLVATAASSSQIDLTWDEVTEDTEAPTVPQNLVATAVSSSQVDLTWDASTDNVGVDHYNIYRGGPEPIDQSATNSYSDTGLDSETTYSYSVTAVDAAGNESNGSATDNATTHAGGGEAGALDAITSRSPDAYLLLDESSGTPADSSGNSLTVQLNGTPDAYQVTMADGPGINLGGNADIQIPHDAVFNTDSGGTYDYTESEPAFTMRVIINESLRDHIYLFGKGDEGSWSTYNFAVFAMADGRVVLGKRSPIKLVEVETPAGTVSQGTEFSVGVTIGGDGIRLTVNGRDANNGIPDGRDFYGLEHREANVLNRNTDNIRIGITQGGTWSDITVNHFAAFFRSTYATRLGLSDLQAIAGTSGAAFDHPVWGNQTVVATESNLQSQIDSVTGSGGGTVDYQGSGTVNANIALKSRVLLKLTNNLTLADDRTFTTPEPSLSSWSLASNVSAGATSISVSSSAGMSVGDLLLLESGDVLEEQYDSGGSSVDNANFKLGEIVAIRDISGSTVGLDRPMKWSYQSGDMGNCWRWTPARDCGIVGPGWLRSAQTNSDPGSHDDWMVINGAHRMWIDAEVRATQTNEYNMSAKAKGCLDLYLGPNGFIGTEGSEPAFGHDGTGGSATGRHPYGWTAAASTDQVANGTHFRSRGWHAVDNLGDNVPADWGGSSNLPITTRSEFVRCEFESDHQPNSFTTHQSGMCRILQCESTNGGGLSVTGYKHEVNGYIGRDDGSLGLGWTLDFFHAGLGNSFIANIDLRETRQDWLFTAKRWFHTRSGRSVRDNTFANISRTDNDSPNNSMDGVYLDNTYDNVESPLPPD